jgi:putative transposase
MILHGRDVIYYVSTDNMTLYKNTFRIESIRLKEYDYSLPGEYFVTICTDEHKCLFGTVIEEDVELSPIGRIVKSCWEEIPKHFHNIELDEFVIMPNHIHGIIIIDDNRRDVQSGEMDNNPNGRDVQLNVSTRISPKRGTLSVVIRTFKAAVTTECRRNGWYEFRWQPRFYEHIINDERDSQNIRDYIIDNPIKWFYDSENPDQRK